MSNLKKYLMKIMATMLMLAVLLPCVPAFAATYSAAVTSSSLSMYSNSALSRKVGALNKYAVVRVIDSTDKIAKIKYGGYTMYCRKSGLTAIEDMATKATVNKTTRVYEKASTSSRSATLKKGTKVYVLAVKGSAAMIEKNGVVGYTYVSCLDREKNGFDGNGELSSGMEETLTGGTKITYSGSGVKIEDIPATVATASMTVYQSASTSSRKLGTLSYGQGVMVRAYNSKWAYIELAGRLGFCRLSSLYRAKPATGSDENPFDEPTATNPDLSSAIAAVVNTSVKVYASASSSSKKLGTLQKGMTVNVLKYNSTWAYIELAGSYGYCSIKALTPITQSGSGDLPSSSQEQIENAGVVLGQATVVTATAPMYESKNTESASTKLPMGTTVNVHSYDDTWGYCSTGTRVGYIQLKNLSPDNFAELESGDSGDAVTDLEKGLLNLGYFDGKPDATYNADTTTAVERFQKACGITETGMADVATLRVLYAGYAPTSPLLALTLEKGDENTNVKRMQDRLYALGYYSKSSSVDGDFGSNTAAAVKLFQNAAGLSATGIANPETLKAMYSTLAPSLPSGKTPADSSSSETGSASGSGGAGHTTSMPSDLASSTSTYSAKSSNAQKLEYVIYVGQNQLGKKYVFATSGPNTFDCSGFTKYCFGKIGKSLPHSAKNQGYNSSTGTKILDAVDLVRGDLVFFNTSSDSDLCDHVGIYLGSQRFIHAGSGAGKIVVSKLNSGYYSRVYSWGRRVLDT